MKGWVESGLRRLLEKKISPEGFIGGLVGFGRLIAKTVDSYIKDLWMLKLEAVDVF